MVSQIRTLFLDIGGVLLTDGWNRKWRQMAVKEFALDFEEVDERHHLTFDTFEEGKITLDEYLNRVIFYEKHSFTKNDFKNFMFERSQPFPEMLDLIRNLRERYQLRVYAVSNEGRELTEYRIHKFNLNAIFDGFISSCYVHYRKPDPDIYRIALDISQSRIEDVIYIDDRPLFVDIAQSLGIFGIWHKDYKTTRRALAEKGLTV